MALFTEKTEKKAKTAKKVAGSAPQGLAYSVLVRPRITEKAYTRGEKGQYTFQVATSATKLSIKKAVKEVYGVEVTAVNIVRLPGKTKMFGSKQTRGKRNGVKKAYVTLAEGQSIELFKAGL